MATGAWADPCLVAVAGTGSGHGQDRPAYSIPQVSWARKHRLEVIPNAAIRLAHPLGRDNDEGAPVALIRAPPLATLGWLRAGDRLTIVEDMTMIGGEDDDAASLRCGSQ